MREEMSENISVDKNVHSYIQNGEVIIDKIFRLRIESGQWPARQAVLGKKKGGWFYYFGEKSFMINGHLNTNKDSFIIQGLFNTDLSKYEIKYVYEPPFYNGWYLTNIGKSNPQFIQKSKNAEKWIKKLEVKKKSQTITKH